MSALRALELPFDGAAERSGPSHFHPTLAEQPPRRGASLIRRALLLDQEDAYSAGEVGFLARALVQATCRTATRRPTNSSAATAT